jgi:hypothetical protein
MRHISLLLSVFLVACSQQPTEEVAKPAAATPTAEVAKVAEPEVAKVETPSPDPEGFVHYGAPVAATSVVSAATLLANPEAYVGKELVVEGRVADVCSKAGCWMVIAEGDKTMRILMKDHGFSVDKQGAGSTCRIAGLVEAKEVDAATVAHFQEESRNPELMPEKAAGKTYQMVATGVALKKATPVAGG